MKIKNLIFLILASLLPVYGWCSIQFQLPELSGAYRPMADELYHIISRQAHYRLQQVRIHRGHPDMKLLTPSIHGEHGIRPNTGAILGFSFLYRFGDYEEKTVGISKEELLTEYIIPMINYVTATYESMPTDDGRCWNKQWQSAHWAYSLGKATWYLGEALPEELKAKVCYLVRKEAERFYQSEPPHRIKNDTAAEENAWNSQIFHVASLLMPENPEYPRWQELFRKWVLSSYVTEADVREGKVVDGFNLGTLGGGNIYDDYTLENHDIVHPDYMTAFILSFQTAVDYRMTQREIPSFLLFNIPQIYANLKWFATPDGGMTYPSGQDWGLFRNPDWLINHVYMAAFAHDSDAWHYAKESFECIRLMQKRHDAGNIYSEDETEFPPTQSDIFVYLAQAWQALHFTQAIKDDWKPLRGVRQFKNGKILLNKSDRFIHSLCYGNQIMFLPTLNAPDRVFDASLGSGIGNVWLKGAESPLPVTLKNIDVESEKDAYKVRLTVMHGSQVEATYFIQALPERLEVKEVLKATEDCNLESVQTARFGVLNDSQWIREQGMRTLEYEGQKQTVRALSGKVLEFQTGWLNLDKVKFHISKSGNSRCRYEGTSRYKAGRATDVLTLNFREFSRSVHKGEILSEFAYTISL